MTEYEQLLVTAQEAARKALQALRILATAEGKSYQHVADLPREIKSIADYGVEQVILDCLSPSNLPILSEEAGAVSGASEDGLRWVVDPLDGTVNFVRGLAPCAVSVALWRWDRPVFGVLAEYPSGAMAWGGRSLGAYIDGIPVHVSAIQQKAQSVLCTGFPSRFDFEGAPERAFWDNARAFGKVRMMGAASLSLLHVARGAADAYTEQDIMIWDVAAGLALVEGAGGYISVSPGRHAHSHNIFASNGLI
jgi:myo-inositol-1(or 4)-monophosphatase